MKKLKELGRENTRLEKRVADLSLDKDIQAEALKGNYKAPSGAGTAYVTCSISSGSLNGGPARYWGKRAPPSAHRWRYSASFKAGTSEQLAFS